MRKRLILSFAILATSVVTLTFLTNVQQEQTRNPSPIAEKNSRKAEQASDTLQESQPRRNVVITGNDTLSDIAHFIAGIKSFQTRYLDKLEKDTSWIKYCSQINSTWRKLDTIRYQHMEKWASLELENITQSNYNLFYPFSGPDFLNADIFFPGADTICMFGLEPIGSLPDFSGDRFKDSLYQYVNSLRKSLRTILNLSFFITKDMFKDFKANDLNGTTHLLLWFAARRGYDISSITPIAIATDGNITHRKDTAYRTSRIKGVEIACTKNGKGKVVRYFSADLSNYGLKKNGRLEKFLLAQNFTNTLVKSASYLMHAGNFTNVREFILNHTNNLLQDDTGIPYKFFSNTKYHVTLFGAYEKPIHVFSMNYQDDLKKAYDSLETKKLPFGIGYKYRQNESTWILVHNKQKDLTAKLSN